MRQSHKAGEKLFIDYSGNKIPIINSHTGEVTFAELFVCVWGVSNYTYTKATYSQQLEDWIMSHVHAFGYFGCVPKVCVPDNLKSGINKSCRYEPDINRTYLHMAQHYGTVIIPARPYKAKDKAKVEVGVLIAQRWIIAVLRNRKFYSLGELNQAIRELLEIINNKVMKKIKKSRRELFETLDKPASLSLPEKPYEYAQWKKCRVNIDYHIEIDGHYYSVPYQLNKEQVEVRYTTTTVEIFFRNKRITSHVRDYNRGKHTTLQEHMPQSHRKCLEWTPTRIIEWAGKSGPNIKELVKSILESRKYPEQGYRSCLGIIRLGKYYPVNRIENACKRALKFKTYSYKSVKNILEYNLDRQVGPELNNPAKSGMVSLKHEKIRDETYYQEDIC
jgi:transposase